MTQLCRKQLLIEVKNFLQHQCRGPENALRMHHIYTAVTGERTVPANRINKTRILRSIVEQLRLQSCPIGDNKDGYFWATTPAQLEPTLNKFHSRTLNGLAVESALRNVSQTMLIGRIQTELAITNQNDEDEKCQK